MRTLSQDAAPSAFSLVHRIFSPAKAAPQPSHICDDQQADATLLQLCSQILINGAHANALYDTWESEEAGIPADVNAELDALDAEYRGLVVDVGKIHARTKEGLAAKARVTLTQITLNADKTASPGDPNYLVFSLCVDAMRAADTA